MCAVTKAAKASGLVKNTYIKRKGAAKSNNVDVY